jgi:hypothetical protein
LGAKQAFHERRIKGKHICAVSARYRLGRKASFSRASDKGKNTSPLSARGIAANKKPPGTRPDGQTCKKRRSTMLWAKDRRYKAADPYFTPAIWKDRLII